MRKTGHIMSPQKVGTTPDGRKEMSAVVSSVIIDWGLALAAIGTLGTVVATVVSVLQTARYSSQRNRSRELERIRKATVWGNIAMVLEAYQTLDDARGICASDGELKKELLCSKISSARSAVVTQYQQLLKEAALASS